ncbi:MAG: DUF3313 family protein [Woeseiaceae bacterium]|nr:DUF3313 family protein [Woeseiaceae bacterium]
MNKFRLIFSRFFVMGIATLAVACTSTPTIQTGPDAEVSFDGLHKVDNAQADLAWARPDFDISGYTKLLLVSEGIEYTPAKNKGRTTIERSRGGPYFIDEDARARFEALVRETFADEMSKIQNFEIVTEPGPDVLMVRGGLLDVTSYVPMDPMDQIGRGGIYLSQVGEATLVLELRDSETGAILARSIDRRAAEQAGGMLFESNRVTNAAEVRRLVRFWGRRLRENLDGWVARQQSGD